jgi:hypothetical protein
LVSRHYSFFRIFKLFSANEKRPGLHSILFSVSSLFYFRCPIILSHILNLLCMTSLSRLRVQGDNHSSTTSGDEGRVCRWRIAVAVEQRGRHRRVEQY